MWFVSVFSLYHLAKETLQQSVRCKKRIRSMEGVLGDPVKKGIIPLIVNDIFSHIYAMEEIEYRVPH